MKEGRSSLLFRKGLSTRHESTEKLSPAIRAKEEEVYGGKISITTSLYYRFDFIVLLL